MTDTQPIDSARKNPKQARARHTVATLLDTTARILAAEGGDRLSTNHLARKSGFSVGTIYQYFPNREAIVLALIERQRADVRRRIATAAARDGGTVEERLRAIVRILHDAFDVHRKPARRLASALVRLAATHGLPAPSDSLAEAIVTVWRDHEGARGRPLNDAETFVLTRGLVETLRHAVLHGSALLGTREFEDALLRMVLGFLRADSAPPA